jgi:uncharacterized repeat protein (TIGR01451 family)
LVSLVSAKMWLCFFVGVALEELVVRPRGRDCNATETWQEQAVIEALRKRRRSFSPLFAIALSCMMATGAVAGSHDVTCPTTETFKLCRDGNNCPPGYPVDNNDVLKFHGAFPGDTVTFNITNDSAASATFDLTGQDNTSFSQFVTLAAGASSDPIIHTVGAGDNDGTVQIKITIPDGPGGNPSPTLVTYTAACTSTPPPTSATIIVVKHAVNSDGTFTFNYSGEVNGSTDVTTVNGDGSTFISVSGLLTDEAHPVTVTEAGPPSGWTFTSLVADDSDDPATIVNGQSAAVQIRRGETVTLTFTNTWEVAAGPDLTISKSHSGNATQGQTGFQYSLTVTNVGDAATNGEVSVTDALPSGLTTTDISGTGWTCILGTLTCTRSDPLPAGGNYPDLTLMVDVAANAPASVTNVASVAGGGDVNTANNTSSDQTTVLSSGATLILSKSALPDTFAVLGEVITYNYTITNAGSEDLTQVSLTDDKISSFDCSPALPANLAPSAFISCTATHQITETDMFAGVVKNVAQASGLDPNQQAVQSNQASATVTRRDEGVREITEAIILNFLHRRADLLLSEEPDRNRYIRRLTGSLWGDSDREPGTSPGSTFSMRWSEDGAMNVDLSTGLRQMQADAQMRALDKGAQWPDVAEAGLDVWMEAHYAHFSEKNDVRRSGDFGVFYAGIDYLISPSILVGALVQYDLMTDRTEELGQSVRGSGWMVGPYVSVRLTENLFFDARAAWGRSENFVNPLGFYTDTFETERWLARANLTGNWTSGNWRFTPSVSVAYFQDAQAGYTDTLGVEIPSQKVALGRVTFGPEIAYRYVAPNRWVIETHVTLVGIENFSTEFGTTLDHVHASPDPFRAKLTAGVLMTTPSGASFRATASYDGIGARGVDAVGAQLWLNIPLR